MLKSDPNLERIMQIHWGMEKMFIPHGKFWVEKANTLQTTLDNFFFTKIKHFKSQ